MNARSDHLCIACAIIAGAVGASIGVLVTLGTIAWFVLDWSAR